MSPLNHKTDTGDNVGMDAGAQIAEKILEAIKSGRDLWILDQFIVSPHRLECARKLLIQRRDKCSDPDEAVFLTSIIRGLDKSAAGAT